MRVAGPLVSGLIAGFLLVAGSAIAAGPLTGRALSVGYPNGGKLVGGRRVRDTAYLKVAPGYARSPAKYALPAMLDLLDRAARKVARKFPGSVLGVGELSAQGGGRLAAHHSHQNGRDADVGFYLVNARGRGVRQERFVACDGDGRVRVNPTTRFDDARNWAFVAALLEDGQVGIRDIFVSSPLRARLLAYAEKIGAPSAIRERAAMTMMQPVNAEPHDDHFHVRIACPPGQHALGCIDDSRARGPSLRPASGDAAGPTGAAPAPARGKDDDVTLSATTPAAPLFSLGQEHDGEPAKAAPGADAPPPDREPAPAEHGGDPPGE